MNQLFRILSFVFFMLAGSVLFAQTDTMPVVAGDTVLSATLNDSINRVLLDEYSKKLQLIESQRIQDSTRKAELEQRLKELKTTDNLQKEELLNQLREIEEQEKQRIENKKSQIDSLRKTAKGYPVVGVLSDTLFYLYTKIGASTPSERAAKISQKIRMLYDDDFLKADSIIAIHSENTYDIVYKELIVMSISENDAIWYGSGMKEMANDYVVIIRESIVKAKEENSIIKLLTRIGLVIMVLIIARLILWLIGKGYRMLDAFIDRKKDVWLKDLSYRDYTFLTTEQELQAIEFIIKASRWFIYAVLLYVMLPIIFSIFPFSRTWANALFELVWLPLKGVFISIWNYLPNLFSILVIYVVMKYVIKFVKYIFNEIGTEKLKISGFHSDWAMPTYSIVKFLLYAFMFVLIFPYLPGSDSNIFKGVSVFIGVLFSLGSSSAIANMVAGLVITYMRPFKLGDRIKIGDVTGDVIEKTLLVTRIKTVKNEIITIPNSSVLTGNTTNYSSEADKNGLIMYTTVTIGYDVPWKDMHQALIDAAGRTDMLLKNPKPFVLQTSLDDFYVSYQLNAYTREATKQAMIYSNLHQNIQDVCNERGIEILSPHYRAARDGNNITIPANYLASDYKAPSFNVNIAKDEK